MASDNEMPLHCQSHKIQCQNKNMVPSFYAELFLPLPFILLHSFQVSGNLTQRSQLSLKVTFCCFIFSKNTVPKLSSGQSTCVLMSLFQPLNQTTFEQQQCYQDTAKKSDQSIHYSCINKPNTLNSALRASERN